MYTYTTAVKYPHIQVLMYSFTTAVKYPLILVLMYSASQGITYFYRPTPTKNISECILFIFCPVNILKHTSHTYSVSSSSSSR